jgi:poly-gamma-glutamate synthesis protein (capsule biosynthesis protein)
MVVLGLLVLLIGVPFFVIGALAPARPDGGTATSPSPSGSSTNAAGSPGATDGSQGPSPTAAPVAMPIVPVVAFWSDEDTISLAELKRALRGRSETYRRVVVPRGDRDAIAAALDVTIPARVREVGVGGLANAVRDGALGVMRLTDVGPAVRALAIDDVAAFGVDRAASLEDWPVRIEVADVRPRDVDPAATWTMVAAGDILLDRGVARQVTQLEKGVDFPYDGGFVEITGYTCCSGFGHKVPAWERTGERGAVRELLKGADLALANLETPVDDEFSFHTQGTVFTGDPELLDGVKNAGIDYLSLANNHIGDAGADGITETTRALRQREIAYSGAGAQVRQARRPAVLEAGGQSIAVISCDAIASYYWATGNKAGSYSCEADDLRSRIRAAKREYDVVILWPHWGVEYRSRPTDGQRALARSWTRAGADIVIGNHAHWAAAMEEIDGKLVFYALGNFVFDQMWSEPTMEGVIVELTFQGTELRQVRLHPTLLIDQAQPNFMDPAGDGAVVIEQMQEASTDLLPY